VNLGLTAGRYGRRGRPRYQ